MSDTPFSFKAARPARKTAAEVVNEAAQALGVETGFAPEAPKRKRRTRAEIEAAAPVGNDIAVLKVCLKALRGLPADSAARVVATLQVVFG